MPLVEDIAYIKLMWQSLYNTFFIKYTAQPCAQATVSICYLNNRIIGKHTAMYYKPGI